MGHINGLFLQIGSKQTKFKGCSACLSPLRQIWYLFIYGLDIVISEGISSNNIWEINFIWTDLVFILMNENKKFIKCIEIIKSRNGNLIRLIFTKIDAINLTEELLFHMQLLHDYNTFFWGDIYLLSEDYDKE